MFQITSDLSLLLRREQPIGNIGNDVLVSGVSGVWVTLDSNGNAIRTQTNTQLAWPVFNSSSYDGTILWTPDVTNALLVTTLSGNFYARTDQFYGSPVTASPLKTGTNGQLTTGTENGLNVAYCVKAPYTYNYLGKNFTVIDIYVF